MKKFQFRLETLLKYRKILEEQAQVVLAEADRVLKEQKDLLESLEKELENTIEILYQKQSQSIAAEELALYSSYIKSTKVSITTQAGKVYDAEQVRHTCLKKLEEAMRQRKLVENFKGKQFEKYQIELLQEEQKYLDEIGTQLSIRDKARVV